MNKPKKRPSKTAKAAQKLLGDSKLLANKNADAREGDEFKSTVVTPRTNVKAIKPRPDKKRG